MDIEEIEFPNIWIPIRLLRDAAEVRPRSTHRKTASSPPLTPSTHITKSFNKLPSSCTSINLHSRYNTASIDTLDQMKLDLDPYTDKKIYSLIKRLNEEISILSHQLSQSNKIICNLNNKINDLAKRHVIHLQALQERHEQKLKKNKQDFEFFLNELTKGKRFAESEVSKFLQNELENSNLEHQSQVVWMKELCVNIVSDLKDKYDEEVGKVKRKYKEKIEKMKGRLEVKNIFINKCAVIQTEKDAEEEQSERFDLENACLGKCNYN